MTDPLTLCIYSKDIDLLYLELKKYEPQVKKEKNCLVMRGYRTGAGSIPEHFEELENILCDFSKNHESVKLSYVVGCTGGMIYDCIFTNGESKSFKAKPITPEEIKKRMGLIDDAIVIPS